MAGETDMVAKASELVTEIEELGSGRLTTWEAEFVDSMSRRLAEDGFSPTAGQMRMLEKIREERC